MSADTAAARLAASWLLWYPDERLDDRLAGISAAVLALPAETREPLSAFLAHMADTSPGDLQQHYVSMFDMKRRACPYLTYWTDGDTRNRGVAILKFKQAYQQAGFDLGTEELADHLAVLLEFTAVCDELTGEALLHEYQGPIHLLHEALVAMGSVYAHVTAAIIATLPELTPALAERIEQIAQTGPPTEHVGLEPFSLAPTIDLLGGRR